MRLIGLAVVLAISLGLAQLGAEAQQAGKVPRIGVLWGYSPSDVSRFGEAFRQGLASLGYVEGRNIVLQERWSEVRETEVAARASGVRLQVVEVRDSAEFDNVFATMTRDRAQALLWLPDPMFRNHLRRILDLAAKSRLPALFWSREPVEAGGLMSYGANIPDMYRQAAIFVDRILKGANPAEIPIEQPSKFELVINLKTAKALGLTIPQSLLVRADQLIE
jgi:ABC-type uncharacterized transport system substrate-binding protein